MSWARVGLVAVALALGLAAPASAAPDRLTLVVPGAPGGGWDLTAKALREAILAERLAGSVEIVRYPGAGGLVGLAQFANRHRGDERALLVGGLTMVGAAINQDAGVSLRDVAPVARLAGDWGVIAVRADSGIRTIADLAALLRRQPQTVRWTGGSLGSPDQALVWNFADRLGVSLDDVTYYGRSGGGAAVRMLLDRRSDVAVSGYSELAPYLADGRFRALAVDAPRPLPGLAAPTLRESGIDVSIMNWRGVFAAPGLSSGQEQRLAAMLATAAASPAWKRGLVQARWTDAYLDSAGFTRFIDRETARWPALINPPARAPGHQLRLADGFAREWLYALCALLALVLTAAFELLRRLRGRQRAELELATRCGELSTSLANARQEHSRAVLEGIQQDFGEWNLSHAERDIAWFMLRGLPLKQIAGLRGTSERTVRQQAQAIYRKAGLESRSDLAGRVLERFI